MLAKHFPKYLLQNQLGVWSLRCYRIGLYQIFAMRSSPGDKVELEIGKTFQKQFFGEGSPVQKLNYDHDS